LAEVPIVQNAVASPATLAAAQARRITNANFVCESCGSAFTREFNLKSKSLYASSEVFFSHDRTQAT
jgi:transposase-like protein